MACAWPLEARKSIERFGGRSAKCSAMASSAARPQACCAPGARVGTTEIES